MMTKKKITTRLNGDMNLDEIKKFRIFILAMKLIAVHHRDLIEYS